MKQELYDALKDKRIIIEDLREQLAFRYDTKLRSKSTT